MKRKVTFSLKPPIKMFLGQEENLFQTKGIANAGILDWLGMLLAGTSRNEVMTSVPRIVEGQHQVEGTLCSVSRRAFLAAGTAVGASAFLGGWLEWQISQASTTPL